MDSPPNCKARHLLDDGTGNLLSFQDLAHWQGHYGALYSKRVGALLFKCCQELLTLFGTSWLLSEMFGMFVGSCFVKKTVSLLGKSRQKLGLDNASYPLTKCVSALSYNFQCKSQFPLWLKLFPFNYSLQICNSLLQFFLTTVLTVGDHYYCVKLHL